MAGRIGLLSLSILMATTAFGLVRLLTLHRPPVLRPFICAVVYISFIWLSPQGYYTYYRLIFDGLPAQSVIGTPPRPDDVLAYLTFSGRATLSAHATGALGWLLLGLAFAPRRRPQHSPAARNGRHP